MSIFVKVYDNEFLQQIMISRNSILNPYRERFKMIQYKGHDCGITACGEYLVFLLFFNCDLEKFRCSLLEAKQRIFIPHVDMFCVSIPIHQNNLRIESAGELSIIVIILSFIEKVYTIPPVITVNTN